MATDTTASTHLPNRAVTELAGHDAPQASSRFALRYRSYQAYITGSFISWTGDWMDLVTLNWAVLHLTGSALYLGLINACRLVPVFALSLPAGILADRMDRRRLLLALQAVMMILTFAVGWLVAARAPFWLFAVVVTVRSIFGAMVLPVRHALVSNLVPPTAIPSAVATQTAAMGFARIAGPALAGALLAVLPLQSLFWINGSSFVIVLFTLLLVRPIASETRIAVKNSKSPLREIFTYIKSNKTIQSLLVLAVVPMVFGFPYTTLMPLFARDLLNIGPAGFGLLLSLAAAGALTGSIALSLGVDVKRVGLWLMTSILGFGICLMLFTIATHFWLAAGLIFLVGLLSQIYRTLNRITFQAHVPDHLRGRILSIAMMDRGFIPLGVLLMGAIAEWAGTMYAGLVMGGGCVLVTLAVLVVQRGIGRMTIAHWAAK